MTAAATAAMMMTTTNRERLIAPPTPVGSPAGRETTQVDARVLALCL
jgi:hypothetical protein